MVVHLGGRGPGHSSRVAALDYSPLGILYNKSSWADLSDFNVGGTAPTIVSNAIQVNPATRGGFTQYIELKTPIFLDEQIDVVINATCVNLTTPATAFGLGVGKGSKNAWGGNAWSVGAQANTSASPNTINLYPNENTASAISTTANPNANADVRAGDSLTITFSQSAATFTTTVNNLTRGVSNTVITTNTLVVSPVWNLPNTCALRIYGFGGSFNITGITVTSRSCKHPRVLCLGDSKTAGNSAGGFANRWTSIIASALSPVTVMAGPSDRTVEVVQDMTNILNFAPKNVILNIGRNDLAAAVLTATWQANYSSIVSQLAATGTNVIHLMPIPEVTQVQTTLTSYINTTYPSGKKIDVSGSWVNGTHLSSDNVHPNAAGYALIANAILSSGLVI